MGTGRMQGRMGLLLFGLGEFVGLIDRGENSGNYAAC